MRLGALPRDFSKPAPTLEAYLQADLVDPLPRSPKRVDRETKVTSWPMYGNDRIGDCTVAAILHTIASVTAYSGTVPGGAVFTDDEAVKIYSAVSGYDPVSGANDNGATLADVCRYMTVTGATDVNGQTHKLLAWAEVGDPTNTRLLKRVLNAFGSVYLAIQCPESALQQAQEGKPWTVVNGSPIAGGHAIDLQYSSCNTGDLNDETVITWGKEQRMNEAFAHAYIMEAIAVVPEGSVDMSGKNPVGLDIKQLVADCQSKYLV